jgi:hypothetical protein
MLYLTQHKTKIYLEKNKKYKLIKLQTNQLYLLQLVTSIKTIILKE